MSWEIRKGHVLDRLREMPDESVQCAVTSPPYWGLRDYGLEPIVWGGESDCEHEWGEPASIRETTYGGKTRWQHVHNFLGERQESRADREGWRLRSKITLGAFCARCGAWAGSLGLEPTPELYVEHLVEVFREVHRVLRNDGTLWLNLGDCYNAYNGNCGPGSSIDRPHKARSDQRPQLPSGHGLRAVGLKPKDLVGVPWRAAFALQAAGWWLRSDIIWSKPAPMPESIRDRPTKSHEYLFLLTKSQRYFYDADAIKEKAVSDKPRGNTYRRPEQLSRGGWGQPHRWDDVGGSRNRRSVWEINTQPFPNGHFATYPPKLVELCILAGTAGGGLVLDPFCGASTTGLVALRLERSFIGIELNPEYVELARRRIIDDAPLFNADAEVAGFPLAGEAV